MISSIHSEVIRRGITRLCHFTPSRNLAHIAGGEEGILATKNLKQDERSIFTPTDLQRLDGHEGYISCSIEYPNVWYFDKAKAREKIFKDWVILFINPRYLWLPGTRFCPRNAAASYGRNVLEDEQGFLVLFTESIVGAGGKTFRRSSTHLSCCPTDDQAEVLIPDRIAKEDILAIGIQTATQAKNETIRFQLMNLPTDGFRFIIAPDLYEKQTLSKLIRSGKKAKETSWIPKSKT